MSFATFGEKLVPCKVAQSNEKQMSTFVLVYKENSTIRYLKLGRCEDLGTNKMIICDNIACFSSSFCQLVCAS